MIVLRLSLAIGEHVIKGIVADALQQPLHPIVLFVIVAGAHAIHLMLAFHHLALGVRLARFDKLSSAARVQLKAVLFLAVGAVAYRDIFQRNNTPRLFIGGVLKVIQAVVIEDEPAPLPALVTSALFPQPAFLVRVEESMHQVVTIVLGDLKRLRLDALIQSLENARAISNEKRALINSLAFRRRRSSECTHHEELARQVLAHVDAAVHAYELLRRRLVLYARIVQRRVEHNDGERQHVARVGILEDIIVALAFAVPLREALHHAVYLLRLARQSKTPEELPTNNRNQPSHNSHTYIHTNPLILF